ncbi:peptidylprolyl isomerase [Siccirubricoccus sp. KC 17139]|uniref:Parvulin-like PPIase n=1 Tax=Siccirubricoccus soli TaxID=2899147 RepID=A0ABT1D5J1_9PROT|nr:peptidylprolyl isomerase [Siccirubricoccus soli]MCO6417193.1 peptidylprolyl isomerase [Siccirubricoccus soli]MCP2683328.1 peptidylprolyl isomerase [Siccirubricoccus soli]
MSPRLALLAACLAVPLAAQAQAPEEDPILARVNGEPIRQSDMLATASEVLPQDMRNLPPAMLAQVLPPDIRRQLLDRTITERALVIAARAAGLDKDEEVRRRIRRAEEQELQQAILSREVTAAVTEEALRARYDRDAASRQGEEEVHARHILLASEADARAALAEVNRPGADFAEVARRRSRDPGARDGGDLGFFKKADMVPEFADAAFALQPGQITSAPVRSPFGWHVIKVEGRRRAAPPSFEDSRAELRQALMQEQVQAVVARLRGAVQIERVEPAAPAPSLLDGAAPPPARR